MPVVTFDESVKGDLAFLGTVPAETAAEFGGAAARFLAASAKPAALKRVAGRLGVDPEVVEAAVAAASRVMLEAARLKLGERDFVASLREADLPAATAEALWQAYDGSRVELEDAASRSTSAIPRLQGLEWRLEVEFASRARRGAAKADAEGPAATGAGGAAAEGSGEAGGSAAAAGGIGVPSFLLRLDTLTATSSASAAGGADDASGVSTQSKYAQCDYATLALIKARLEAALAELGSAHAKRVHRYLR
ncbi:hypothetical protein FNF27_05863 [Cafeteria roenbergensis]|uniref:COMM domain-containing protein n=1 Tax=Cafeteria roenbergensis TaxID=33653 RepID=A0A5A8D399_CAFRO|nr:hypothetical protein FNF29_02598 [Cafeteria roenbergensis]KAA0159519.1 hypothetical protein FNF31_04758 [Cafeteria roenbergensis]KAA0159816.1 hypothetical protein FNF28_05670 [Cafeteria roenbergensis]KAA0172639.1 hypothetical protein FNF27_05863 [Cafeteria roenbergensis]|eukprot:KAA0154378.1 hypothetical protein FNF29_02598 [Cafeteria roenbergensis]